MRRLYQTLVTRVWNDTTETRSLTLTLRWLRRLSHRYIWASQSYLYKFGPRCLNHISPKSGQLYLGENQTCLEKPVLYSIKGEKWPFQQNLYRLYNYIILKKYGDDMVSLCQFSWDTINIWKSWFVSFILYNFYSINYTKCGAHVLDASRPFYARVLIFDKYLTLD